MAWSSVFSRVHQHHRYDENPEPVTSELSTMEDAVTAAEGVVLETTSTTLFDDSSNRDGATRFLGAVADLQRAMHFFVGSKDRHGQEILARAHKLTQAAMARLQEEFYQLLSANRHKLIGDAGGLLVSDLRSIAESMVTCGHGKECFQAYQAVRRFAVDEALFRLGFPHLAGTAAEPGRLKSWPLAARTLFSEERELCDGVFGFADEIRETAFAEVVGEGAVHLFAFPETAAKAARKSPEKMFELLEAYDALVELIPELDRIFSHGKDVRLRATTSMENLADAVRLALAEFEDAVRKYISSTKGPVPGAAIHPLTRYAMNYLAFLADYGPALSQIFADHPLPPHKPLPENFFLSNTDAGSNTDDDHDVQPHGNVASHVAWLLLVILCRLDGEAGLYKDNVPLAYLFLANNLTYIASKVRSSALLRRLLGSDWVAKQEQNARNYAETYEKLAWKEEPSHSL